MKKIVLVVLLLVVAYGAAHAQGCAVCTKAAAGLDDKSAKGLNGGIIYLAFLPLLMMGALGLLWWKSSNSRS